MALQIQEFVQDGVTEFTAEDFRYLHETNAQLGEGVAGMPDLRVAQRASGANMSVDVAVGIGWVRGDLATRQGVYHVVNDATANVTVSSADSTDPRIDQIVLRIYDDSYDGSGNFIPTLEVLVGTPTATADLDNRLGAADLPDTALRLADVLVSAGATSITDSDIKNRAAVRDSSVLLVDVGDTPTLPLGDVYTITTPLSHPLGYGTSYLPAYGVDTEGSVAIAIRVATRISGVTALRWVYTQDATTATTGNYEFDLWDMSGRWIVGTGSVAFTGATSTTQNRSETIDSTDFEPGVYYLSFSTDTPAGGGILSNCFNLAPFAGDIGSRGLVIDLGTGIVGAPPDVLDGGSDLYKSGSEFGVPVVTLATG